MPLETCTIVHDKDLTVSCPGLNKIVASITSVITRNVYIDQNIKWNGNGNGETVQYFPSDSEPKWNRQSSNVCPKKHLHLSI